MHILLWSYQVTCFLFDGKKLVQIPLSLHQMPTPDGQPGGNIGDMVTDVMGLLAKAEVGELVRCQARSLWGLTGSEDKDEYEERCVVDRIL